MQSKILSKRTLLLIVIFSGLTLSVALFLYFIPQSLSLSGSAPLTANISTLQKRVNSDLPTGQVGLPVRIKIPSINIDAPVEYVGFTSNGAMDVPKGPVNVAWFNLGPRPGENGSAIIAGHYGWKNNIPAVFDNLHKLNKGDKISIEDENEVVITFVVREIRTYSKDETVPYVFSSNDGKAHLNLITCIGVWNKAEKTYSERLVVFTDKE